MSARDNGATGGGDPANLFVGEVRAEAAEVLGLADAARLGLEGRLPEGGLDSLMSLELRNRLARKWGRALPAALVAEHPTVAAIARYLGGPPGLLDVGNGLQPSLERLARSPDVDAFNEAVPLLNDLASAYALQALGR